MRCTSAAAVFSVLALASARPAQAKAYKGAEVDSIQSFLYGRIEVRMRMLRGSGLVSAFFTYKTGSETNGALWGETDVEALGKNGATTWQSNIITGNPRMTSEQLYTASASLADGYHTYAVEWTPDYVSWSFDGVEVRKTEGGQASALTDAETLRFNAWSSSSTGWAGTLDDTALPAYQFVNWIKYYRYDNGQFVLDWTDDFDTLDTSRWVLANWTFDGNLLDFTPDNAVVQDGTLILAITKEGETGFSGTVPVDDGSTNGQIVGGGSSSSMSAAGCGCEVAGAGSPHHGRDLGGASIVLALAAVLRRPRRSRRFVALTALLCAVGACSQSAGSQTGIDGTGGVGDPYPAGTGNTAGAVDTTGTGGGRVFPTQACLDKASALVAMMTPDERISQLQQIERVDVKAADITTYGIGSVYSQGSSVPTPNTPTGWADMVDGFRRASNASRLKIPVVYGLDVVHGAGPVNGATVFPHNIGLGATRDPALVEEVASAVADEAAGVGADFPFAPVVAVARDERWGRTYESFGETVELAAAMGVAYTNGFQKRSGPFTVLANAKHYLGDGGTADGKNNGDTSGDETALRALHLTPYEAVVGAGVASIMASYSSWQGTKMHANKTMITDVLKGQLGFEGFVGSDYNACFMDPVTAAGCLNAGVDMLMTFQHSASQFSSMMKGLVPATIPQDRGDDAARRILVAKCEMGLLDGALHLVDRTLTAQVGSAEHRALARRAVAASLVVLKNDNGALPLPKDVPGIALGGKTGDNIGNQCGGWTIMWQGMSGPVVTGGTTVRQALEAVAPGHVFYALDGSATGNGAATVGIAVIGETPYAEGCGDVPPPTNQPLCINRPSTLSLDAADVKVVQKMKQSGLLTIVVLVTGRPLIIDTILPVADAIVVAWLPGTEGAGITDVLFGDAHPTGHLPHSWPRNMAQIPINVGDANYDPQFPYAYGLTY